MANRVRIALLVFWVALFVLCATAQDRPFATGLDFSGFDFYPFLPSEDCCRLEPAPNAITYEKAVAATPGKKVWLDPSKIAMADLGDPSDKLAYPRQIWGAKVTGQLFVKGVAFGDANQGQVDDGWLVAAMATGAQLGLVPGLFPRFDDARGIYEVQLFGPDPNSRDTGDSVFNVPVRTVVDKTIPARTATATSALWAIGATSTSVGELWPGLVEKAVAKIGAHGTFPAGYGSLSAGYTSFGLALLFGGRASLYLRPVDGPAVDPSVLFANWRALLCQGLQLAVQWLDEAGNPGLLPAQGYSVLDVVEVPLAYGGSTQSVRLAKLRNAMGVYTNQLTSWMCSTPNLNYEWRGAWSDCPYAAPGSSTNMTDWQRHPAVAQQLQYQPAAGLDGVFWMALEDVAQHIAGFEVWEPLWKLSSGS